MKNKSLSIEEATELSDFLKSLATLCGHENLLEPGIKNLPQNITGLLDALTGRETFETQNGEIKVMASVILSEVLPGIKAEDLVDSDCIYFRNLYNLNRESITNLQVNQEMEIVSK